MNYLRLKAAGAGNAFAEFEECAFDSLKEVYGEAELNRQFRVAVQERKDVVLRYFPESLIAELFNSKNAVRETLVFTPRLQSEIAAFQAEYRARQKEELAAIGLSPATAESLPKEDLRRIASLDLSNYCLLDAQQIGSGVFLRLDTAFGIAILRFDGVTQYDADELPALAVTTDTELFFAPGGYEFNLALGDGGLRVRFSEFRLEFEFLDLVEFVLTYHELPYTSDDTAFHDTSILFNAYAAATLEKLLFAGTCDAFENVVLSLRKLLDLLQEEIECPPHRSGFFRFFFETDCFSPAVREAVDSCAPPLFRRRFNDAYTLYSCSLVYDDTRNRTDIERQMERLEAKEALSEGAAVTEAFSGMIARRAAEDVSEK